MKLRMRTATHLATKISKFRRFYQFLMDSGSHIPIKQREKGLALPFRVLEMGEARSNVADGAQNVTNAPHTAPNEQPHTML